MFHVEPARFEPVGLTPAQQQAWFDGLTVKDKAKWVKTMTPERRDRLRARMVELDAKWPGTGVLTEFEEIMRLAGFGPPAEVKAFPPKLAEVSRDRQAEIAKQDARLVRENYQRVMDQQVRDQQLIDQSWQRNLDRWAEERRQRNYGFHRGWDEPA